MNNKSVIKDRMFVYHTLEMIGALSVASTALMGLTGVFFGYIKFSKDASKQLQPAKYKAIRLGLSYSMVLGIIVIIISLVWYVFGFSWAYALSVIFFFLQSIAFAIAAYNLDLFVFW